MKKSLSHVCRQDSSLQGPGAIDPAGWVPSWTNIMWIVWIKTREGTREPWDDPQQPYGFLGGQQKNDAFCGRVVESTSMILNWPIGAAIDVALIPDNWFLNAASAYSYRLKLKKGYIKNKDHDIWFIWWIWRFRLFFLGGKISLTP